MRAIRYLLVALGLSLALPAWAGDAADTYGEVKHETKKDVREMKPHEDAGDKAADAKDSVKAEGHHVHKKARHAGKKAKHATEKAGDRVNP